MEPLEVLRGPAILELLDQTFTKLLTTDNTNCAELPLFVAIDIEAGEKRLYEVGFSTFDPCCLLLPNDLDPESLNNCITTNYYAKAGNKNRRRSKPYRLGIAQPLQETIVQQVTLFDTHLRPERNGKPRSIILVGHHIASDLSFLRRQFGLCLSRLPNLEAIIDTQYLSQLTLKSKPHPSLKHVLQELGLDYIGLHNAGHDSRYTLRALLMLFATSKQSNEVEQSLRDLTILMEHIARCHKVNARRTWTPQTKIKLVKATALFDQDVDDEFGMLSLLA